ncbi:MAG: glycerol-3-phosphate dehydrogenase/oxidase [Actinobacteria bacterium]|nr:glycerol-3-phosphate dehydrogenase/oxidase [Actinomycetota bacterium]OPZ46929.1 MAG: Aerobic glycerol-3-phosphate dehydrogenase [Actinobacteria bacterium ADurb.BinA094]
MTAITTDTGTTDFLPACCRDAAALGPPQRAAALERLATDLFDVLVVGGGATGCGIALDAAGRGLRVAMVEKRDWAAGTSSRSSKLIHGGLRYLEQLDIELVREALQERRLLVKKIAPHLVHPMPILMPLRRMAWDRAFLGSGLLLYDALAGLHPAMPRHRHLSRRACLRAVPSLREDALHGGIRFYDAQVDDARLSLVLTRTAAALGATCVSAAKVVGFLHDGGRVAGARVADLESGVELDVHARTVINATGVWTNETERLAGVTPTTQVRPSKGVHLVVPKDRIHSDWALILPTEKSVLFVLPWAEQWIIGTTDTDWRFDLDHPAATRTDAEYLLERVNTMLVEPLTLDDVTAVYAGLRPLLGGDAKETAKMSRKHMVWRSAPGLVSIAGGKYTTYRLMARDAVDAAAHELPFAVDPSRSADQALLGAVGLSGAGYRLSRHPGAAGLSPGQIDHLVARHGTMAMEILDLIAREPDMAAPLPGADKYVSAEVHYAVTHEGALHIDDVLTRRTHVAFEAADRGALAADAVARIMAPLLGWDATTAEREAEHYRARLDAERAAQSMLDDETSNAARMAVRDLRVDASAATG